MNPGASKSDLRRRNDLGALLSGKIVKGLLLQTERKSQGIGE
jgi:hypothetical protein